MNGNTILLAEEPGEQGQVGDRQGREEGRVHGLLADYLRGGAQAVAALAYGTRTVPRVDKIVGPGNKYVTAAKMIDFEGYLPA